MKNFPHSPIAVVQPDLGRVRIAKSAWFDDGEWYVAFNEQDAPSWTVTETLLDAPDEVRFVDGAGLITVIRPARESDAEIARNHPFFPGFPLPVPVIGAIMNNLSGPVSLYAAVDPDGDVATMVLFTDVGVFARYSRAWQRVRDTGVLGDMVLVEVGDNDLDMYDQADEYGRVLTRGALTEVEPGAVSAPPIIAVGERTSTLTASAPVVAPIISSAEDLVAAIDFANDHPDARWYVQRRARALGHTDPLPWEN